MSILNREPGNPVACAIGLSISAGLLYIFTAARDIVVGDSPELITAAALLGVAHEPGYPLFTILGHLFSLLPCGSIPFRVNLFSVVCDAVTVGVVYLLGFQLTRSRAASAVAALLLAVNPLFWSWSLVAEVFPLNNLLAALLILLVVIWYQKPERTGFLIAASFVAGLALTNHHTIVLLGPAVCFMLWRRRAFLQKRIGVVALCAGTFLIGLLPYAYLPWASARHPAYNWGNISSFNDFIGVVTRKTYGTTRLVSSANVSSGGSPVERIFALLKFIGPVSGVLVLSGAIMAYRRERGYFWFILIAFVFAGPVFATIANLDLAVPWALSILQRFFLLPVVIVAPLAALGLVAIAEAIVRYSPRTVKAPVRLVAAIGLVAVAVIVVANYRRIDLSKNHIQRRFAEDLLDTAEPGSVLLARGDIAFAPIYLQKVENTGRHTTVILLPLLATDWYVRQLRQEHQGLVLPFDRYDVHNNNLKKIVEANRDRMICIAGTIGGDDHSLEADYWPYQRGLLLVIEPRSKSIPLDEMITENERLLNRYRLPAADAIRSDTLEMDILTTYAWPAFRIGKDCETVGLNDEAQKWYERALRIDRHFSKARDALSQLTQ